MKHKFTFLLIQILLIFGCNKDLGITLLESNGLEIICPPNYKEQDSLEKVEQLIKNLQLNQVGFLEGETISISPQKMLMEDELNLIIVSKIFELPQRVSSIMSSGKIPEKLKNYELESINGIDFLIIKPIDSHKTSCKLFLTKSQNPANEVIGIHFIEDKTYRESYKYGHSIKTMKYNIASEKISPNTKKESLIKAKDNSIKTNPSKKEIPSQAKATSKKSNAYQRGKNAQEYLEQKKQDGKDFFNGFNSDKNKKPSKKKKSRSYGDHDGDSLN